MPETIQEENINTPFTESFHNSLFSKLINVGPTTYKPNIEIVHKTSNMAAWSQQKEKRNTLVPKKFSIPGPAHYNL